MQGLLAFLTPIALFIFWSIMGFAVLSLFNPQGNALKNSLLSPIIGVSITILPLFWLSRFGLPVSVIAWPLALSLLFISLLILIWQRPVFPLKDYFPFAGIFLLALSLTGYPLLQFGFDWVSYVNDDMTNYCLLAARLLKHGFFQMPKIEELLGSNDGSLLMWYLHVPGANRCGAEFILAFVSGLMRLKTSSCFMPTILSLHLILISSTAAFAMGQVKNQRLTAWVAALLLTFSALTSLGTLYQLIAQVLGLSLLVTCIIFLLQPIKENQVIRKSLLFSLIVTATLISYPEVIPFIVVSFMLYTLLNVIQKKNPFSMAYLKMLLYCLGFSLIFANKYLVSAFNFLYIQMLIGFSHPDQLTRVMLFPYYLIPSGLANFWGLQAFSVYPQEPWLSISILFGAILSLLTLCCIGWVLKKYRAPSAIVVVAMLLPGVKLFLSQSDFGLYKLAMYLQPFLLVTFAIFILHVIRINWMKTLLVLLIISVNFYALIYYASASKGLIAGSAVEVPFASSSKISQEFAMLYNRIDNNKVVLINDPNLQLFKLAAIQFNGKKKIDSSPGLVTLNLNPYETDFSKVLPNQFFFYKELKEINDQVRANLINEIFISPDSKIPLITFLTLKKKQVKLEDICIISSTAGRNILNHRHTLHEKGNFVLSNWASTRNFLEYVNCSHGFSSSVIRGSNVSLHNVEKDLNYPGKIMQGIGQYLLFKTLNPSSKSRMSLDISNTLTASNENKLPSPQVIGQTIARFGIVGRGSARVFSPPLTPQKIGAFDYLLLNMERPPFKFPHPRTGLMKLYGDQIEIDVKQIVSFSRDISLISNKEYESLNPPAQLEKFPQDLANMNLEYSGIYEDGWISEESFFILKKEAGYQVLQLKLMVPEIDNKQFTTQLTMLLDGKEILVRKLPLGLFDYCIPLTDVLTGKHKVELHFNKFQKLPRGDNRPVVGSLKFIGFK